jgi:Mrp family chromosome partitioning ATPase
MTAKSAIKNQQTDTADAADAAKTQCGICPSHKTDGKAAAVAVQDQLIRSTLQNIRFKLFIMSGKGGVGKSSIAVNLAAALALKGFRVGLLDVDIHGPSIPHFLGLSGGLQSLRGSLLTPQKYGDRLFVVSTESLLKDPDQAILWRGPMKISAIRQFIADVDWGHLDYLVIDSPPGTGDEPMTVLKTIPEALSIVVTTPQEISLADVRKAINFLQYAHANILGLVENMSGLICPHCSGRIELFKTSGGKALAQKYGLEFLGAVPLDPAAVMASDLGKPVVMLEEDTPAKQALLQLAESVIKAAENSLEAIPNSG